MTALIQIITGCLGSAGFALLYNVRGKRFAFSALGGLLAILFYIIFGIINISFRIKFNSCRN